ncbi:Six-hairpin glycosidase [Trametes gibbosa]|nr:Six-hairpin glycosidase [Trametes gibbosa]
MIHCAPLSILLGCAVAYAAPASQAVTSMGEAKIAKVKSNLLQIATHSWEIGTAMEALTELEWPSLSVFGGSLPPPVKLSTGTGTDVINWATQIVRAKPDPNALPLIDGDGAVGDPASIGVAVELTNWTRTDRGDHEFSTAAGHQLRYLLDVAPRTSDGAISHRSEQVQLWADFVYMAPPFIAYFGALEGGNGGLSLLKIAYQQCKLYRQYLRDSSGLWKHIVLGSWQDNHHWGTGNAWAAAGMLRVLETIRHSNLASKMKNEQADLKSWINEVVSASWQHQHSNGTLFNYIDESDSFADSSSTALLASVTYRMAALTGDTSQLSAADKAYNLIKSSVDSGGWLRNTVDPLTFNTASAPSGHSPEGQAFVLLLQSAYRDYHASGFNRATVTA